MTNQNCPLCNSAAKFHNAISPRHGKLFDCPVCGKFLIDLECEVYLAELPEVAYTEHRRRLSDYSRSFDHGSVLVIHAPDPGDPRVNDMENQTTVLVTDIHSTNGATD